MSRLFQAIRERYHPLHKLRSNAQLYKLISTCIDHKLFWNLPEVSFKVRLRFLKHLPWMFTARNLEPAIAALFIALSKTMNVQNFFDVGSNIGFYSWLLLSQNRNTKVVLFEPDPDNATLVRETIAKANLATAILIEAAASDATGKVTFARDHLSGASGTIDTDNQTFMERQKLGRPDLIEVASITLDDATKQTNVIPDLIKIDVEGAEEKVLHGSRELIAQHAPMFIIECGLNDRDRVASLLTSNGYLLFDADNAAQYHTGALNILAVPQSRKSQIDDLFTAWRSELSNWLSN